MRPTSSGPTTSRSDAGGGGRTARHAGPGRTRAAAGFTLIELMIALAIVALGMTAIFRASDSLLPQTRLTAAAKELGGRVELARTQALLSQDPIVFVYDLDHNGSEAYNPFERDGEGRPAGVGRFPVFEFLAVERGVEIREVRLPGAEPRREEQVSLSITPQGRMTPHEVVLHDPDHPDTDVLTLRISGLSLSFEVVEGDEVPEIVDDASFR